MKLLNCMVICIAAIIVVSCTKEKNYSIAEINGKSVFQNKNIPANEKLVVKFEKLYSINNDSVRYAKGTGLGFPLFFQADGTGNLFVLDFEDKKIKKYDKDGKFIASFGNSGNGPGEYLSPSDIFLSEGNVYVNDVRQRSLIVFDDKGNFQEKKLINKIFTSIFPVQESTYLCSAMNPEQIEGKFMLIKSLAVYDSSFNLIKELNRSLYPINENENFDPLNYFYSSAIHKNKIYLATNSVNDYEVEVFDLNGSNIESIKKNYFKHELSDGEFLKEKEFLNSLSGTEFKENFLKYRNSISGIFNLKNEYLLVTTPKDLKDAIGIKFDIFKDNVFQKSVIVDIPVESELLPQIKIVNDRLYTIDRETNSMIVYKIEVIE